MSDTETANESGSGYETARSGYETAIGDESLYNRLENLELSAFEPAHTSTPIRRKGPQLNLLVAVSKIIKERGGKKTFRDRYGRFFHRSLKKTQISSRNRVSVAAGMYLEGAIYAVIRDLQERCMFFKNGGRLLFSPAGDMLQRRPDLAQKHQRINATDVSQALKSGEFNKLTKDVWISGYPYNNPISVQQHQQEIINNYTNHMQKEKKRGKKRSRSRSRSDEKRK